MNKLDNLIIKKILEFVSYCRFNSDDRYYNFLNKLYNKLNNDYHNENISYNYIIDEDYDLIYYIKINGYVFKFCNYKIKIKKINVHTLNRNSFNCDKYNTYFIYIKKKSKDIKELIKLKQLEDKKINQCIAICKTLIKNEFKRPFDLTEDIMSCY